MSPRHKLRKDGTPAQRSRRTPIPPPPAERLAELEQFTDGLPVDLRAYRDGGLLSARRRYRLEEAIRRRTRTLAVVLWGVYDPHNQAAVLRTAEALGIQEVHLVPEPGVGFRPSSRVTQNAHRWLDLIEHDEPDAAVAALGERGLSLLAAAPGDGAIPLQEVDFCRPVAVVLGSERDGLPRELLERCDGVFTIPLHGLSQSFNISVAAAVILFWAVEMRRRAHGRIGDLGEEERMDLRRRFYALAARGRSAVASHSPASRVKKGG